MSAWFLDSELSTCLLCYFYPGAFFCGSHKFPAYRSLLLSTTVLNNNHFITTHNNYNSIIMYVQEPHNTGVVILPCVTGMHGMCMFTSK